MSDVHHYPHCLAMNGDWVCNRDQGHEGPHESRSGSGSGCIGWATKPNETYYLEPPPGIRLMAAINAIKHFGKVDP